MSNEVTNPLLSIHKSSDSGLQVHLHPLVLLIISDHITRHILRRQEGPIVGALLGQQKGREISIEHAFECQVIIGGTGVEPREEQYSANPEDGKEVLLSDAWFRTRLAQYKDVHKDPALELVGWFTTAPTTGPELQHLPIHHQITNEYNENAILLTFHPSRADGAATVGGKLPLTIYESTYESVRPDGPTAGERSDTMEIEGQTPSQDTQLGLRFRELPYSIETGEAEMISVDSVAKGGSIAATGDTAVPEELQSLGPSQQGDAEKNETQKEPKTADPKATDDSLQLSADDEELISSLTVRANAVRMLLTRIQLLKFYLTNLPPSYLTSDSPPAPSDLASSTPHTETSHAILRSIQALISRLPLLLPPDRASFEHERLTEKADVLLVDLLGNIGRSVKDARELGKKFNFVEGARQSEKRSLMIMGDEVFAAPEEGAETVKFLRRLHG